MVAPEEVVKYWVHEIGPKGWYAGGEELTLAYIILTDQFPRNMFHNHEDAFATDQCALAASKMAIEKDWDQRINEPERQFFYMPLMHSESLVDQDRCIRLLASRMPETGHFNMLDSKVHREIIRKFGRFPYRNDPLGRETTKAESAWTQAGGYGATKKELEKAHA